MERAHRRIAERYEGHHVDHTDPWWFYYEPHKEDADALMRRMRQIGTIDR